jgi:Flp pilus assembly protein TadD
VFIPPEWLHTPPQPKAEVASKPVLPSQEQLREPLKKSPIIKRGPAIKERDVTGNSQLSGSAEGETGASAGGTALPSARVKKEPPQPQPQYLASMHLVDQAKEALAQGQADAAISVLEQAIQVDVYNGDAFFNLAKAWKMKGNPERALEFARKAEIIFQEDTSKLKQVYLFEADIYRDLGDVKKADSYQGKASGLR